MKMGMLAALKESIACWVEMRGTGKKGGIPDDYDCPLCRTARELTHCYGPCSVCPVKARTSVGGCHGTPFYDAQEASDELLESPTTANLRKWRAISGKEIAFLVSLLPKKAKKAKKRKK